MSHSAAAGEQRRGRDRGRVRLRPGRERGNAPADRQVPGRAAASGRRARCGTARRPGRAWSRARYAARLSTAAPIIASRYRGVEVRRGPRLYRARREAGGTGRRSSRRRRTAAAARGAPRARRARRCRRAARPDRPPAAARSRADPTPAALPRRAAARSPRWRRPREARPECADRIHEPMLIGEVGLATRSMCRNRSGRPSSAIRKALPP